MPDFDDYIAYKMTSGGNNNKKTTNSSPGCLGSIGLWLLVIYILLNIAAKILY